jgi:membrane protein
VSDQAPPAKTDPISRLTAWVLALPAVRWLMPIFDDYGAAGGGLLASGVAFNSLFAILPSILLVVSLLGMLLGDPARLREVVTDLGNRFPPLEAFFEEALADFSSGAVAFSILGLVGLIWGSSRFYQSLDDAIARIFLGSPRRDPIQRGVRGVLSVAVLIGAVVAVAFLSGLVDRAAKDLPLVGQAMGFVGSAVGSALTTILIFSVAVAVLYRIVPQPAPSWRAIRSPAVLVGVALGALTGLFAVIAPRLVGGSLSVYGAFVAVFAAMIWLSYVAQAILVGAAWVHRRTVEEHARLGE